MSKKQKFKILAVPCRRPFVVAADKAEAFKNSTNTKEENEQVRKMAETFRKNNMIFDYEFPHFKVTEELREDILKHPEKYANSDIRTRMGLFRTEEEQEEYIVDSLNRPLPDIPKVKKIGQKTDKK